MVGGCALIGGRIVPAFTASALKQRDTTTPLRVWAAMTPVAVGAMLALTIVLWTAAFGIFSQSTPLS